MRTATLAGLSVLIVGCAGTKSDDDDLFERALRSEAGAAERIVSEGDAAVPMLLEQLMGDDDERAFYGARLLEQIPGDQSLGALLTGATESASLVGRSFAIHSLARRGHIGATSLAREFALTAPWEGLPGLSLTALYEVASDVALDVATERFLSSADDWSEEAARGKLHFVNAIREARDTRAIPVLVELQAQVQEAIEARELVVNWGLAMAVPATLDDLRDSLKRE